MKLRATVTIIHKNETHKIRSLILDDDGNIKKILTVPERELGPFYEIEGDDLAKVKIDIKVEEGE